MFTGCVPGSYRLHRLYLLAYLVLTGYVFGDPQSCTTEAAGLCPGCIRKSFVVKIISQSSMQVPCVR